MLTFFILSIIGGILHFLVALQKDEEINLIDVLGFLLAIIIFIAAVIWWFNTGEDPLTKYG